MTNSEQAIREFAEKWARLLKSKDPNVKEMFIAHHNVFVSEHYYPKEFVEWMIKNEVFLGFPFERNNEGKLILSDTRGMTTKSTVFTTNELFNYWEENDR